VLPRGKLIAPEKGHACWRHHCNLEGGEQIGKGAGDQWEDSQKSGEGNSVWVVSNYRKPRPKTD